MSTEQIERKPLELVATELVYALKDKSEARMSELILSALGAAKTEGAIDAVAHLKIAETVATQLEDVIKDPKCPREGRYWLGIAVKLARWDNNEGASVAVARAFAKMKR